MIALKLLAFFLMGAVVGLISGRIARWLEEEMPTNRAIRQRIKQRPQARHSPTRKRI